MQKFSDWQVTDSLARIIEITNQNITKGNSLERLGKHFDISQDEIMAIGDDNNDLSMIKYAGIGVAMGNSSDFIKESSQYITTNDTENGVANAIYKFV